jgi:hypothetical protein
MSATKFADKPTSPTGNLRPSLARALFWRLNQPPMRRLPLALAAGLPWFLSAASGRSESFLALARARRQAMLARLLGPQPREVKKPHAPAFRFGPPYPWHRNITSTVFWVGEGTVSGGGVSNGESAFNVHWLAAFGGVDDPNRRAGFLPRSFMPHENPFYVALPYSDVENGRTKPEAPAVIPWFYQAFIKDGQSVCWGRWVELRHHGKTCYAQWADVGPFAIDHWRYVFGSEPPGPNRHRNAGIDLSPAVRDYLGLAGLDRVDWRFVEHHEVPSGPW